MKTYEELKDILDEIKCPDCHGTAKRPMSMVGICTHCEGTGLDPRITSRHAFTLMVNEMQTVLNISNNLNRVRTVRKKT